MVLENCSKKAVLVLRAIVLRVLKTSSLNIPFLTLFVLMIIPIT